LRLRAAVVALAAAVASSSANAASAPPRSLAQKCVQTSGVAATPFWLTASDGTRLYAIEAGSGATTVVHAGLRVLAFDFRDFGDSGRPAGKRASAYGRDVRAAVARARTDGGKRVFLAGASFGGVAALTFGPQVPVAGVISMSGETRLLQMNALTAVRRLRAPLLILGSREDGYLSVAEARALLRNAGSKDKRLVLYPGGFHGWQIVEEAPYAPKARSVVLSWLRKHGG